MSQEHHRRDSLELITALLRLAPHRYTTERGRWVWVAGKLAGMIIRWARMDMSIRSEIKSIIEQSKTREKE